MRKSSTAKHFIECMKNINRWSTSRFKDFDILYDMFQKDLPISKRFHSSFHGGFDVAPPHALNEALISLNDQLVKYLSTSKADELILIEFARDDYAEALEYFSPDVLNEAYFLFIDADINTCVERVKRRMDCPRSSDDHFISEETLRAYYTNQKLPSRTTQKPYCHIIDITDFGVTT